MARSYAKIEKHIWADGKFSRLSLQSQLLSLYLLSSAEWVDDRGWQDAAVALGWTSGETLLCMAELENAGMVSLTPCLELEHLARFGKLGFPEFGRLLGAAWELLRQKIFTRDNYTCRYCGAGAVSPACDHVIPVSRGGGNEEDNLVTSCQPCNSSKGAKLLSEWEGRAFG